jgi:hypothetical protein
MNTVITHFYNEEYMLPWWINHHKKLFDYGIMINHGSTDRSLEICKQMCPHNWKIVDTCISEFKTEYIDHEVKFYESTVDGFKAVLTLTEFFMPPMSLNDLNSRMIANDVNYMKTIGVCMVDMTSPILPNYNQPLFAQKHHGMITGYFDPLNMYRPDTYKNLYGRFYHNDRYGKYAPGRHWLTIDEGIYYPEDVFVLKYKYSPWNETIINRIMQFSSKITMDDLERGLCTPHMLVSEEHWSMYDYLRRTAYDLKEDEKFLNAYNYCVNL